MKRILVATRRLGLCGRGRQFGVELAAEHEAEIVFVHVVPAVDVVPAAMFGWAVPFRTSRPRRTESCSRTRPRSPRSTASLHDRAADGRHRRRDRRLRRLS